MDPLFIESRLVAATVHGDLARVSREGQVDLAAGVSRVAWPDLPADLNPSEVRIETDRGWIRTVELEPTPSASASSTDRPTDTIRAELQALIAKQEALRAELELLDQVMPPHVVHREGALSSLRPDLFLQGLETITARRRAALADLRRASSAQTDTSRALERAETDERSRAPSHRPMLVATIESDQAGPTRLRITYGAGWATWRPLYQLHVTPGSDRVELIRFGDVWQNTGEDWAQVALQLSTSEPDIGLRLPSVKPWVLDLDADVEPEMQSLYRRSDRRRTGVQPPIETAPDDALVPRPSLTPMSVSPMLSAQAATLEIAGGFEASDGFADYATQFDENGVFAEVTSPGLSARSGDRTHALPTPEHVAEDEESHRAPSSSTIDQARLHREPVPREAAGGVDLEIPVDRRFDALSGADRHRVQLGRRSYPLELRYVLRPGLRNHAFGRAEIFNEEVDPILAGPASIFIGGSFYGPTHLDTIPGQGRMNLELGVEPRIKCSRRSDTQARRQGQASQDEIEAVDVTIDIESRLTVAAQIQVEEQVPVATDPQVRVRLLSTEPTDARLDDQTGLVTFSSMLSPQSSLQLRFSYEVEAPAGFRLSQSLADEVSP